MDLKQTIGLRFHISVYPNRYSHKPSLSLSIPRQHKQSYSTPDLPKGYPELNNKEEIQVQSIGA